MIISLYTDNPYAFDLDWSCKPVDNRMYKVWKEVPEYEGDALADYVASFLPNNVAIQILQAERFAPTKE